MEMKIFEKEGTRLEVMLKDGKEYFPANEVAEILGYTNPQKAIRDHCKEEGCTNRSVLTGGGTQQKRYINEGNLYRLIIKSRLPEAERFEKWIFEEVLPSIRKSGGYIVAQVEDTPEIIMARALIVASDSLKRRDVMIKELEAKIIADAPKVEFADDLIATKEAILIREYAKILESTKGLKIGQMELFKWLRANEFIMKDNEPYARHMKYFTYQEYTIETMYGKRLCKSTKITPEGQIYFYSKLRKEFTTKV